MLEETDVRLSSMAARCRPQVLGRAGRGEDIGESQCSKGTLDDDVRAWYVCQARRSTSRRAPKDQAIKPTVTATLLSRPAEYRARGSIRAARSRKLPAGSALHKICPTNLTFHCLRRRQLASTLARAYSSAPFLFPEPSKAVKLEHQPRSSSTALFFC